MQGITQVLDPLAGKAENLAEFSIANSISGSLNILGSVSPSETAELQATRVDVEFTAFNLQLGPAKVTVPLGWIKPKVLYLVLLPLARNHCMIILVVVLHVVALAAVCPLAWHIRRLCLDILASICTNLFRSLQSLPGALLADLSIFSLRELAESIHQT